MKTMVRDAWTDERLDDLNAKVDQRFDQVDQRFEEVNDRLDKVSDRLDKVSDRLDAMVDRFAQLTYVLLGSMGAIFAALIGVIATQL